MVLYIRPLRQMCLLDRNCQASHRVVKFVFFAAVKASSDYYMSNVTVLSVGILFAPHGKYFYRLAGGHYEFDSSPAVSP